MPEHLIQLCHGLVRCTGGEQESRERFVHAFTCPGPKFITKPAGPNHSEALCPNEAWPPLALCGDRFATPRRFGVVAKRAIDG